jgi:serine-type D-Ala-D-Ala carboxypeptidase/endopeptidase (penicillin-binding protein 4)
MKRLFFLCLAIFLSVVHAEPVADQAERLIHHRLPNAHIGFEVRDVKTGEVLLAHQPYASFIPASNLKLFTAAASMLGLGKDFRFETAIWTPNKGVKRGVLHGDVLWRFAGDPTLGHRQIDAMVKSLSGLGVKRIEGDVLIDGSRFSGRRYPLGWTQDSLSWAYSAPATAVMVDHNAMAVRMGATSRLGARVPVTLEGVPMAISVDSDVRAVTDEQADKHCNLWLDMTEGNAMHFHGCWPASGHSTVLRVAIQHPDAYARAVILQAFKRYGIDVSGHVRVGRMGVGGMKRAVVHYSRRLHDLIKVLLKDSDNQVAESLIKSLGYQYYKEGSFSQGLRARESLLSGWAGIDFTKSELYDGSGASRYNALTPHQLVQLMYVVQHHAGMKPLLAALPVSGKDGTLQHRMQVFNLAEQVSAKTGSMRNVSSLTGYLTTQKGRLLAFSILMDHVLPGAKSARVLQRELCDLFYNIA